MTQPNGTDIWGASVRWYWPRKMSISHFKNKAKIKWCRLQFVCGLNVVGLVLLCLCVWMWFLLFELFNIKNKRKFLKIFGRALSFCFSIERESEQHRPNLPKKPWTFLHNKHGKEGNMGNNHTHAQILNRNSTNSTRFHTTNQPIHWFSKW